MREDTRTLVFAAVVCIGCSLLLSGTAAGLKSRQQDNEAFDVKRNIVKAFGLDVSDSKQWPRTVIEDTYAKHVNEENANGLPLYTWTDEGKQNPSKYAFPIEGKGLWGDVFGYIAINDDLESIAGISFYKHGETPGLGAEIEKKWFVSQFVGKKLYANGKALDFSIVKPGSPKNDHSVDGISGASLTGQGVEAFLREDSAAYANYFNTIKGN